MTRLLMILGLPIFVMSVILILLMPVFGVGEALPPIAFTTFEDDPEQYYVYDFTKHTTIVVPRLNNEGRLRQNIIGVLPETINIRPPYQFSDLELIAVNKSLGSNEAWGELYTLYREIPNGLRHTILENVPAWSVVGGWSSNKKYLYLFADLTDPTNFRQANLYQYDIEANHIKLLLSNIVLPISCNEAKSLFEY